MRKVAKVPRELQAWLSRRAERAQLPPGAGTVGVKPLTGKVPWERLAYTFQKPSFGVGNILKLLQKQNKEGMCVLGFTSDSLQVRGSWGSAVLRTTSWPREGYVSVDVLIEWLIAWSTPSPGFIPSTE